MIALVIMEIHTLWLVKDSIISCYYHLMWGNLSKSAKFQSGCVPHILLVLLRKWWMQLKKIQFQRAQKMLLRLEYHFPKQRYMYLNRNNLNRIVSGLKGKHLNKYNKTIICLRLSEYCWIIPLPLLQRSFNNIQHNIIC